MKSKLIRRAAIVVTAATLAIVSVPYPAEAAKKVVPKLSSTKVTMKAGKTKTVKITNAKKLKIKKKPSTKSPIWPIT